MNSTNGKSTQAESIEGRNSATRILALGGLLTGVSIAVSHLAPTKSVAIFFDNLHWTLSSCSASIALWYCWMHAAGPRKRFLRWFSLGYLSLFIGQLIFDFQSAFGTYPIPDIASIPFLLRAILIGVGFLVLLSDTAKLIPVLLDSVGIGLMLMGVVLAFYLHQAHETPVPTLLTLIAYPGEFFILSAICWLVLIERDEPMTAATLSLGISPFAIAILWTIWNSRVLKNDVPISAVQGDLFSIVNLAWAWGAIDWRPTGTREKISTNAFAHSLVQMLPLILVLVAAVSLGISIPTAPYLQNVITVCFMGVVIVTILRQSMVLRQREQALANATSARKIQHQMEENQRLAIMGTIAGGVAHDINNLLTVILGTVEIVSTDQKGDESQELLRNLESATILARDSVDRILRFSRQTSLELQKISLEPILKEGQKMLTIGIPRGHLVSVETSPDLPDIRGNSHQLIHLIMNLGINASDAIGDGHGRIDLSAVSVQSPKDSTTWVEICVSDTGSGMSAETLANAFDPFFTTKGEGTGLGLCVVKQIVTEHHGRIEVESLPGEGTKFRIYLPATSDH